MRAKLLSTALLLGMSLSLASEASAQQAPGLTSPQRDSLELLRQRLLTASAPRPTYGYPDLDRLFRYEPPKPYSINRGYDFLHAFAASQVRSRQGDSRPGFVAKAIDLFGGRNFDFGSWQLGIDGLADILPEYNKVDGQWLGYELQLVRHLAPGRSVRLRTSNNYALRSRNWYTENHLLLYYAPEHNGLFVLSGGRTSRRAFHITPGELYRGYFAELPAGNSPVRDYAKVFAGLSNRLSLGPQIDLATSLLFEDRRPLLDLPLTPHRALIASGQLLWAPSFLNDRLPGSPVPIGHRRELGLSYQEAFTPGSLDRSDRPYSRYRRLEAFARGTIPFDADNKLHVQLSWGRFLDQSQLYAVDAKYFPRSPVVGRQLFRDTWSTLPWFFSGGEQWTTQALTFTSNRLALSRSKGFGEVLRMDEALHARQLFTWDGRAFSELGYSLGWGELTRFGLFGGYDWSAKQAHLAFRISLPILTLTSSWSERY